MKTPATKPDNKDLNEWIGLIADDAARADVIKTIVSENAKTERDRVQQEQSTKRDMQGTDGYHFVRGFLVVALVIFVIAAAITANSYIDARWPKAQAATAASAK